ncbi:hypothetical protein [Cryptosporangium sp. NPDC051539]|uniref:hypothetical protein n=1 Tax=Cryptosporangium sp. NPDC051539 TaxID=3363962 RepID=UPI003798ED6E
MTPSELDQLADFAEGLLDGTPDGDAVAGRIATDQEWADAYRQLTASLPGITTALGDLDEAPMPDDVAARLEAALAAEPPLRRRPEGRPRPSESDEDGPAGPWVSPEPDDRLSAQRAARSRRSRAKVGQWVAAVAAVALIALCGVGVFRSVEPASDDSASTSSAGDSAPSALAAPAAPGGVHVSGTSYSTAELGQQARAMLSGPTQDTKQLPEAAPPTKVGSPPVPAADTLGALQRLTRPTELAACLGALGLGQPLAVDYATLEGTPAVVIVTEDTDPGRLVVVAAGANCGIGGAGDERARTTVAR